MWEWQIRLQARLLASAIPKKHIAHTTETPKPELVAAGRHAKIQDCASQNEHLRHSKKWIILQSRRLQCPIRGTRGLWVSPGNNAPNRCGFSLACRAGPARESKSPYLDLLTLREVYGLIQVLFRSRVPSLVSSTNCSVSRERFQDDFPFSKRIACVKTPSTVTVEKEGPEADCFHHAPPYPLRELAHSLLEFYCKASCRDCQVIIAVSQAGQETQKTKSAPPPQKRFWQDRRASWLSQP